MCMCVTVKVIMPVAVMAVSNCKTRVRIVYIAAVNMSMLNLECVEQNPDDSLYCAVIQGPVGRIQIRDLVWIVDRQDLLEIYYWESWSVLQGAYHCCFSLPGKVVLLDS
jgi:hypothetical protein